MEGLCKSELDNFESIVNMIAVKDGRHEGRITRAQLQDFIVNDM